MKNVLVVGLVILFIGFGLSLFKDSFHRNQDQLVPDTYHEVKLIKVIDANTLKFQYVNSEDGTEPFIVKPIYTENISEASTFIDTTLREASHIYIEMEPNNYVDDYNNSKVWIWYFDNQNEEHLLQEELMNNNLVEVLETYSSPLMYEDRINK